MATIDELRLEYKNARDRLTIAESKEWDRKAEAESKEFERRAAAWSILRPDDLEMKARHLDLCSMLDRLKIEVQYLHGEQCHNSSFSVHTPSGVDVIVRYQISSGPTNSDHHVLAVTWAPPPRPFDD